MATKKKVHFLHVRKTGGSALKSVLADFVETPRYSLELHSHGTSLKDIPTGHLVVFFLRDPLSRFISGFYSRRRKGQPRYLVEWTPSEKQVFDNFSTPNEIAVSLSEEHSSRYGLALNAMNSVLHFKPYSAWYVDFDYFTSRMGDILFIGFQESLEADFDRLKAILGIPSSIQLPVDHVVAHRNPFDTDQSIDPAGLSALQKWYRNDYEFLSLCTDLMASRLL